MNKILAISTTGIGNMVLYTPVLKTLRAWYPDARITLLCGSSAAAEVVRGSNMTDDIWVLDKSDFLNYIKVLHKAKREKFDTVITSYLDKSLKVAVFSWLTGAEKRVGYDSGPQKIFFNHKAQVSERIHEVQQNLNLLKHFDSEKNVIVNTEFFLEEKYNDFAAKHIKTTTFLFGFHPGSGTDIGGNTLKRWPAGKYAEVANMLIKKFDSQVIIFGGPEEKYLGSIMAEKMVREPLDMTGKLSIKETAALIKRCSLFISNDSGLMHIAASFGIPVAAVFGPTLYWKNYPWGTKHKIIRKELDCSPCYQFHSINCKYARCLEEIEVNEVFEACLELIAG
ncbi:lipopolysaccharide heptosyltransferase II [Elusimicrobiota bacterium]